MMRRCLDIVSCISFVTARLWTQFGGCQLASLVSWYNSADACWYPCWYHLYLYYYFFKKKFALCAPLSSRKREDSSTSKGGLNNMSAQMSPLTSSSHGTCAQLRQFQVTPQREMTLWHIFDAVCSADKVYPSNSNSKNFQHINIIINHSLISIMGPKAVAVSQHVLAVNMSQKILLMFQCALGLGAIAADGVLLPVPTCNKKIKHIKEKHSGLKSRSKIYQTCDRLRLWLCQAEKVEWKLPRKLPTHNMFGVALKKSIPGPKKVNVLISMPSPKKSIKLNQGSNNRNATWI